MTITPVVLGIATLGTPGATPGCPCAMDTTGSIAVKKGIINFIGLASRFSLELVPVGTKHQVRCGIPSAVAKKFRAAARICVLVPAGTTSRIWYYTVPGA